MILEFHRDMEVERNRWWLLYAVFAATGMFFAVHFTLDVQSGEMSRSEALVVGGTTAALALGIVIFIKKTARGRLELTLQHTTLLYTVGQAEHRLELAGGAELMETGSHWAFVSGGQVLLVPRRVFPRVKQELAAHPAAQALIVATGRGFTRKTPLRMRILTVAVVLFAASYFALMLFGLLVKAGVIDGPAPP